MKQIFGSILGLVVWCAAAWGQTLGGNTAFTFAQQPNTAQLAALGGVNISTIDNNVGLAFHNPALLRSQMGGQLNASFNHFIAGIANYSLTTAAYLPKQQATLGVGVNYFNYGTMAQTDAAGTVLGTFNPKDYVVEALLSKQYKQHWWYGLTIKYFYSGYAQYTSSALAADIGLAYYDSSKQLQTSLVVKNLGTQLKAYAGGTKEELPFDVQWGITKRLAKAPVQLSLTAQHLQQLAIFYNDSSFNAQEGNEQGKIGIEKNVLAHLVVAAQIFLHQKLAITLGYNFLRRTDLNVYNGSNGLNGFTMGVGLHLAKLQIAYATGLYQQNSFHQLSLNMRWKNE